MSLTRSLALTALGAPATTTIAIGGSAGVGAFIPNPVTIASKHRVHHSNRGAEFALRAAEWNVAPAGALHLPWIDAHIVAPMAALQGRAASSKSSDGPTLRHEGHEEHKETQSWLWSS